MSSVFCSFLFFLHIKFKCGNTWILYTASRKFRQFILSPHNSRRPSQWTQGVRIMGLQRIVQRQNGSIFGGWFLQCASQWPSTNHQDQISLGSRSSRIWNLKEIYLDIIGGKKGVFFHNLWTFQPQHQIGTVFQSILFKNMVTLNPIMVLPNVIWIVHSHKKALGWKMRHKNMHTIRENQVKRPGEDSSCKPTRDISM